MLTVLNRHAVMEPTCTSGGRPCSIWTAIPERRAPTVYFDAASGAGLMQSQVDASGRLHRILAKNGGRYPPHWTRFTASMSTETCASQHIPRRSARRRVLLKILEKTWRRRVPCARRLFTNCESVLSNSFNVFIVWRRPVMVQLPLEL